MHCALHTCGLYIGELGFHSTRAGFESKMEGMEHGKGDMMRDQAAKSKFRLLVLSFAAVMAFANPTALYAQSCALCYQVAANSGANFIQALKRGILVLLFPPLLIGAGIVIVAFRKRHQWVEDCAPTTD
jgi:hypothetical protein